MSNLTQLRIKLVKFLKISVNYNFYDEDLELLKSFPPNLEQ